MPCTYERGWNGAEERLIVMVVDIFEKINKKVRAGQVTLFLGAGFSLKAGAPSVKHLVNCIGRLFPKGYRKGLRYLPLDDIASEYVKYCRGDRQPLVDYIKKKMKFKRKDLSDQTSLANIPHFKNIFTTNYDTLLEEAYSESDIKVVRCDADCSKPDRAVNIYKVHGDVICPDEMVITRGDYDSLLCTERNSMVWTRVKDAFAGSDVLFIGYSLDDTNVQILLDKVSEALKGSRREVFLMAPDLSEEKIYELTSRNIEYINSKAEVFLKSLTDELKNNVYQDLVDGRVPSDIAVRFFELYGIKTVIEYTEGKITIKMIDPSSPSIPQTLHLTMKANGDNAPSLVNFDFEKLGDRRGQLGVPSIVCDKDNIVDFERRINGVKVMDGSHVSKIEIGPSILKEDVIDLVVPEIEFIESVPYKSYRNMGRLVISLDTPLCYLDFSLDCAGASENNCAVTTRYKDEYGQYGKAIAWTNFMIALFEGKEILLGGKISMHLNPDLYPELLSELRKSITYYGNVHKIEVHRKQTFVKHPKYNKELGELVAIISNMLSGETLEEKLNIDGRIECRINPDAELPIGHVDGSQSPEYATLRMSTITDKEVVFNDVNFGRIMMQKDLLKCHIEKIYEMDGEKFVIFAPDVDHWNVKYLKVDQT